ncbi:tRNA uridine-5-carboxymethylaminomethyl(34) synthesis GTPase MnmE [Limnohabitans sp. Rim11]|uniref:tRNA uridine-5-carboxymethylaminomethyl(34) synthesis GTPase MnmE n=1 Tax=Limnohabitans sp. Rim11 TaxID=1100719 RepID=UPI000A5AF89B|nr:tRNA uridine-5-carboxymethylaminomethyl(34) synthesis GTPase MnmE [Limnohabitans sp. Rim11]
MLSRHQDPIIAIATAPGRGAVGIVRVSGPQLKPWADAFCGKFLQARQAHYLPFNDDKGDPIDQGLAIFFPGPHSYTGEDVLELQAHGGPVVLQLLLSRCLEAAQQINATTGTAYLPNLRLAAPGEFTQRAFLNDKIDLAQAEAIADLIDASTGAAARSASRSLAGDFSKEINTLRDGLVHLRMLVEATLDFPEEEIDFLQKADAQGQLDRLQAQLVKVLARTQQGALLREGIKVVIAGQPNAGKSSLLNALAGAELAIVTPIAGTTRDVVQQTIQIEGVPVHVIDTAGLREGEGIDEVEKIGIQRAWEQIAGADAVLFLHDLTRQHLPEYVQADTQIQETLTTQIPHGVTLLHVWNKCDIATDDQGASGIRDAETVINLSAKTGQGIEQLRTKLLEAAGWQPVAEGLYLARARHVQALERVQAHLEMADAHLRAQAQSLDLLAEELRLSQSALNEITGEFSADDLLGVIFSSFCIGK